MAGISSNIFAKLTEVLLPKGLQPEGKGQAPAFDSSRGSDPVPRPITNSHQRDLLAERSGTDDDLIQILMRYDSDVAAATHAYLTLANTEMSHICYDEAGQVDAEAQQLINQFLVSLGTTMDYSQGFTMNRSLRARNEKFRYMLLKRGSIAGELIYDRKLGTIKDMFLLDTGSFDWTQAKNGILKPQQKVSQGDPIPLDFATVYYSSFRQDPSDPYSKSFFISVINTIYARTQIINDLYRLMNINGFPRIKIELVEETIRKHMPQQLKNNAVKSAEFINSIISQTQATFQGIRPDQPLVHTDSSVISVMNERSSGMTLDISPIIKVLDSQNQSSLKTMATIIGRGESGVNTASVEARIFSLSAAELNDPLAELWEQALTFVLRLSGSLSRVVVKFAEPELRADNELEPARTQKQARLHKDLSLGMITDDEYHLQMYNRLPPAGAPKLSGTNFLNAGQVSETAEVTKDNGDQPNSVQRQTTRPADRSAASNANK